MTLKDWLPSVITLVVTLVGLYYGPKRAVDLALKQFHQQKLWEKRVEIYQQLISDMSHLYNYYSDAETAEITGGTATKMSDTVKEAARTLARHSNAGGFIISPEAETAIQRVLLAMSDPGYDFAADAYGTIALALKTNLPVLKLCARHDCKILYEPSEATRARKQTPQTPGD